MDKPASRLYSIYHKAERPGQRSYRLRIGSATLTQQPDGTLIMLATFETIPLNWNGECAMFPSKPNRKEDDE